MREKSVSLVSLVFFDYHMKMTSRHARDKLK